MGSAMGPVGLYELLSRTGNKLHILYNSTSRSSSSTNPSKRMTGAGCEISSPYIDEPSILTTIFHIQCPHRYCATITSIFHCPGFYTIQQELPNNNDSFNFIKHLQLLVILQTFILDRKGE